MECTVLHALFQSGAQANRSLNTFWRSIRPIGKIQSSLLTLLINFSLQQHTRTTQIRFS